MSGHSHGAHSGVMGRSFKTGNNVQASVGKWKIQRIADLIRETKEKCKNEKMIMKDSRNRALYTRYFKNKNNLASKKYNRFDKPKSFEIDKSASTEDDDVFEEE